MRLILVDTDVAFTSSVEQRYKKLGLYCQVFTSPSLAFAEIKKNPDNVDLVMITRELVNNQDGLILAQNIRKDSKTADVPFIIVSTVWGKPEFAKHQKSDIGANAYFNKKSALVELDSTIEAVTGFQFHAAAEKEKSRQTKSTGLSSPALAGVQLMAANEVVNIAEEVPDDISLEQPIQLFSDEDYSTPAQPPQAAVPKKPSAKQEPKAEAAPVPVPEKAPVPVQASSIEISLDMPSAAAMPVQQAPAPVAAAAATPSTSKSSDGAIEISIGESPVEVDQNDSVSVAAQPDPFNKKPSAEAPSELALGTEASRAVPPAPKPVAVEITGSQAAVSEEEAAKDLPYLFAGGGGVGTTSLVLHGAGGHAPPVATPDLGLPPTVVSDDVETLKRYLSMREQDVAVLTTQLTYAKEELLKYEDTVKRLTLQTEDFFHQVTDLKKHVTEQDHELQHAGKSMQGEVEQLRQEVKTKIDRIKFLEARLNDSAEQYEKLKERVRLDIRKIRVREKELESKLEILKKDSETLISARENKILELKRKIDLLEFNYDTLQDKNDQEKRNVVAREEKVDKIYKILKLAMGVVESEEGAESNGGKLSEDSLPGVPGVKVAS